MLQEGTAEGVNVGVWVFDFANGAEHRRNGLEAKVGQIADVVSFDVPLGEGF